MPLSTKLLLGAATSIALVGAIAQAAWAVDPQAAAEKRRKAASEAQSAAPLTEAGPSLSIAPVEGDVTLGFRKSFADLSDGAPRTHTGVDIKAPSGAAVVAAGDGVVVEATDRYLDNPNWGKVVVIDHGHGLLTRYAHLQSYDVRKGDRVKAGERIAAVGATGKVTGPHLHFETLRDGEPVDPEIAVAPAAPEAADFAEAPQAPEAPFALAGFDGLDFAIADLEGVRPVVAYVGASVASEDGDAFAWSDGEEIAAAIAAPRAFAFVNGDAPPESVQSLEAMLEDILAGREDGEYDLSFTIDGEVLELSSEEPMTDAERERLRSMLKSLKERAKEKKAEMRRAVRLAERDLEKDLERAHSARRAIVVEVDEPSTLARRLDPLEAELAAVEASLEALREIRRVMPSETKEAIQEALAELSEDREDIVDDPDIDEDERRRALAAIDAARAQLGADAAQHNELLERQLSEIEDEIAALKARRAEIIKQAKAHK